MTQPTSLLRIEDVMRRVGFRRNKLYDLINEGAFPRPAKIGRISVWPSHEVDKFVADRIAERDADLQCCGSQTTPGRELPVG